MKNWIWLTLPALFLGGLMVGRWNPAPPSSVSGRRGVSAPTSLERPRTAALSPVTGMLRIPDRVDPPPRPENPDDSDPESHTPESEGEPRRRRDRRERQEGSEGQTLQERIAWAADAWRLRADIARDTFLADAGLGREDSAQFDVLMHAMNLRVGDAVEAWVETVQTRDTVAPEDGVRLMHDVAGALVLTYDEMDRTLPSGWRSSAGSRFDLLTFVDPAVAMPLVGIEDKLEEAGRNRR
jgi:hypothetical protein